MDKLKYIRIQQQGGTYSSDIPIAADANNISMLNGHDLQETLGDLNVTNADDVTTQLSSLHSNVSLLNQQKVNKTELSNYVDNEIASDVATWLNANVTPTGSTVSVDKSLTVESSAADAKQIGFLSYFFNNEVNFYGRILPKVVFLSGNSYSITLPDNRNIRIVNRNSSNSAITATTAVNSQINETFTLPHDNFFVFDTTTSLFSVISANINYSNAQTIKYIYLLYNSNGNLHGPWKKYYDNRKMLLTSPILIAPHSGSRPYIAKNGDNIIYYCERLLIPNVDEFNYIYSYTPVVMESAQTIPHDSFAIYNKESSAFEVVTYSTFQNMIRNNKHFYTILYNSNGNVKGPIVPYLNQLQILTQYNNVPSYYDSHLQTKINKINNELTKSIETPSFIFITDIHYPSNALNSQWLIKDIMQKTGINNIQLNGDYINREASKTLAFYKINQTIGRYIYPNTNTFVTIGNHEWNNPGANNTEQYIAQQLNETELQKVCYNTFRNKATIDKTSLAYYYDDEFNKIRYFVGVVSRGSNPVISSITWIANQLQSVPQGYSVVIFYHTLLRLTDNVPTIVGNASILENVLNAVKNKTSYTYNNVTYNYSNINYTLVGAFCGDYHADFDYTTSAGVHIISTTTDSFQEQGGLIRAHGTSTQQAFDVVVINKALRKIYLTRIGAGQNREFSY